MTSPTYNEIFKTDFGGRLPTDIVQGAPSYNLNDPMGKAAYGMTLSAGGAGADLSGVRAFLGSYNPLLEQDLFGQYKGNIEPLKGLAAQIGYDTSGYDMSGSEQGTSKLYNDLEQKLKDYHYIGGMSAGWDQQGDIRGGARTLYRDDGSGTLNPVTSPAFRHVEDKGNWWQENPDALAVASIIGGAGLAAWLSPVAAAAGDAAATVGGATAAAAPAATAAGTTAASTGAGLSGLSGSIASALGPNAASIWGGLSSVQQAALSSALMGGVSGGIKGGWQGALRGAALGGLTGGVGAWATPALTSATGMPAWAARGLVGAGGGAFSAGLSGGNLLQGALGGGLGSLASSALSDTGLPSALTGRLGGLAGSFAANSLLGGGSAGGSSQGGGNRVSSGGASGGSSVGSVGTTGGGGARGMASGFLLPGSKALEQEYLQKSYAPIAREIANRARRKADKKEAEEEY